MDGDSGARRRAAYDGCRPRPHDLTRERLAGRRPESRRERPDARARRAARPPRAELQAERRADRGHERFARARPAGGEGARVRRGLRPGADPRLSAAERPGRSSCRQGDARADCGHRAGASRTQARQCQGQGGAGRRRSLPERPYRGLLDRSAARHRRSETPTSSRARSRSPRSASRGSRAGRSGTLRSASTSSRWPDRRSRRRRPRLRHARPVHRSRPVRRRRSKPRTPSSR